MLSPIDYRHNIPKNYNTEMGAEKILAELLEPLRNNYDYILIDTCPSLGCPEQTDDGIVGKDGRISGL